MRLQDYIRLPWDEKRIRSSNSQECTDYFKDLIKALKKMYEDIANVVNFRGFEDRGDPNAWDFTLGDLTTDGAWHDLDLSGIVPDGAKAVLLRIDLEDDAINSQLLLRKKGNANAVNMIESLTQVANQDYVVDAVCPCSDERYLEYKASNLVWTEIDIVVKGWWK